MEPNNVIEELKKEIKALNERVEGIEKNNNENINASTPIKITIPGKGDAFMQVSRGGSIKKMI